MGVAAEEPGESDASRGSDALRFQKLGSRSRGSLSPRSHTINCQNPKKLWGMNNEINGITVSSIDIYMCFNDPLNIYNSQEPNIKISDEKHVQCTCTARRRRRRRAVLVDAVDRMDAVPQDFNEVALELAPVRLVSPELILRAERGLVLRELAKWVEPIRELRVERLARLLVAHVECGQGSRIPLQRPRPHLKE